MPTAQIVQTLPQAAILTDGAGVVRAWNDAATRLFGWTADEMIGRPLGLRIPGSARPDERARLERLASGVDWDGPVEDYRKDGSRVWVDAHVRPLRDAAGAVTGVLGLAIPIPPEGAAAERERRRVHTQQLLDSMAAHVAILDGAGRIDAVNRAWREFGAANTPTGWSSASSGLGIDYVALCRGSTGPGAADAAVAADGIEDVLRGRRPSFLLEYPCDSPTEARWFAMQVTPLTGPDGGAVVAHHDITARKLAELTVASQSRRIELALTAAHMGVWRLDLPTRRVEWSAEMLPVVGVPAFEGTLEAWTQLVHPEDRQANITRFEKAIALRLPFTSEFRVVLPGGEIRWLANVAQVECAPTGEVVAIVGTAQDVTARKRSEWAIATYNRILELIAVGTDLRRILEEVVRLIEGQLPGALCSVLIVDPASRCLRFGAGPSLPEEYNRAVDGVPIGPRAGSCGTAAFRKAPVMVVDIAADPLWEDYRDLALRHGLRSCLSVPILSSGDVPKHEKGSVIGTFALYGRVAGEFDRLTYSILAGAERLVQQAVAVEGPRSGAEDEGSTRFIEAAHLAGVAIERDQASRAVRESEARFRAVLDASPSAVYLKELDGRHLFVNRAAATLFGVPQEAWAGKTSKELLPAAVAERLARSEQAALASSLPVEERQTLRLADGREVTALATHLQLQAPGGAPYALCGVLNDITDLVGAQRELERLWQLASDPLCVSGFDGYLKQVTPAWTRLLGWTEEELLARPYTELVHPQDRAGLPAIERRLHAGETVRGYENRYRCRDGSYRCFSWNAIPSVETGTIYGFARDVTEEKRLGDQVRQAQKMEAIGQLASGVAHDFNNLLTVINGHTELLLGRLAAGPARDSLGEVLKAGQRAADLTSQLLAFSRKAIVEPRIVDVNQVVDSCARMLCRLIGEHVRLETRLATIPRVKVDPGQLEQVFMNLAVNARDAMPSGGRLTIATEAVDLAADLATGSGEHLVGRYVRVTVTDTGSGMTPEVKARIFEPFFTTKGPGKGTGLGLATVYGIVRQAGGHIEVESQPGAGSTFTLLLPAIADAPAELAGTAVTFAPRGTETVLVVEDEDAVREIASTILTMQGYTVLTASSGADALRLVSEQPGRIALVLTDVVMPDLGGRAMADMILGRFPGIRILFMSGYTDDAVLRHGVESSRRSFLQKPFTRLSLSRRVREVLDAPSTGAG